LPARQGVAESANLAKSRYVVGLSHNCARTERDLGYAQLLEQDSDLHTKPGPGARGPRIADHLSD